LGSGSFSQVYRARDLLGGLIVAIKRLCPNCSSGADAGEAEGWFRREVFLLDRLQHPGLPRLVDGLRQDATGCLYFALEYVEGPTLAEVLERGAVAAAPAMAWIQQLLDILGYLHARGIVYRDLKAANVMLESACDRLVLIDFGVARGFGMGGGTAVGTWGMVPMEQVLGRAEPRSDLYAAGMLLHALVTGTDPERRYRELRDAGSQDVEGALRALIPTLGEGADALAVVIARATAFDAEARYPDAPAMARALTAAEYGGLELVGAGPPLGGAGGTARGAWIGGWLAGLGAWAGGGVVLGFLVLVIQGLRASGGAALVSLLDLSALGFLVLGAIWVFQTGRSLAYRLFGPVDAASLRLLGLLVLACTLLARR